MEKKTKAFSKVFSKKNSKFYLISLLLSLVFNVSYAQDPAITLKTSKLYGTFSVNAMGTDMHIDMGNGRQIMLRSGNKGDEYDLKGSTIKIYGAVTSFGMERAGITTADFANCPGIKSIDLSMNHIVGKDMDALIQSLPKRTSEEKGQLSIYYDSGYGNESNVCTPDQVKAAQAKNWEVLDSEGLPYPGKQDPQIEKARKNIERQLALYNPKMSFLLNTVSATVAQQLQDEYDKMGSGATLAQLNAFFEKVQSAPRQAVEAGKVYLLLKTDFSGLFSVNPDRTMDAKMEATDAALNAINAFVKFVPAGKKNVYYLSVCGQYLSPAVLNKKVTLASELKDAGEYVVDMPSANYGQLRLHAINVKKKANSYLSYFRDNNITGYWPKKSFWSLIPVQKVTVTLHPVRDNKTFYCTLHAPFQITLPDGLEAYVLTRADDGKKEMYLTKINGQVIPANTPALLKGTKESYDLDIEDGNAPAEVGENLFGGCELEKSMNPHSVYIFSIKDGEPGFYHPNKGSLKPNKVYFLPKQGKATANSFKINLGEEPTTGIAPIDGKNVEAPVYYDLQGRRVLMPGKGIYIFNGKKVIF